MTTRYRNWLSLPARGSGGRSRLSESMWAMEEQQYAKLAYKLVTSLQQAHDILGVYPDPDPRIHASHQWIRIRLRIRILDTEPSIFVIDLQDARKKLNFNQIFSAYAFLKLHLHHISKIKIGKKHKIGGIYVFLSIFTW
jgi:hypothetical protein